MSSVKKDLRLLTSYELFDYTPQMVKESKEQNEGKIILRGIIQKADTLNQNGRLYPRAILEREIRNYQKFILENRALGECDHPEQSVVSIKNVSHIIREARIDRDGTVYGVVELLNTPAGKIVQSLVESGVKIGISSRGVGSVTKKQDYFEVQDDFILIAFDIVSDPSTPQAFLLPEGRQIQEGDIKRTLNKSDRIDRILNDIIK